MEFEYFCQKSQDLFIIHYNLKNAIFCEALQVKTIRNYKYVPFDCWP